LSNFKEITQSWNQLNERVTKIFKNNKKRHFTYSNMRHEEKIIIYIDRETQHILLKISIDIRFKTVLEKDKEMIDIFSQDATITELVKQTDSYTKLEDSLLAYRESERTSTIYSRLSD